MCLKCVGGVVCCGLVWFVMFGVHSRCVGFLGCGLLCLCCGDMRVVLLFPGPRGVCLGSGASTAVSSVLCNVRFRFVFR